MALQYSWSQAAPSVLVRLQQLNLRLPRKVKALFLSLLASQASRELRRRGISDWSAPLIARGDEAVRDGIDAAPSKVDVRDRGSEAEAPAPSAEGVLVPHKPPPIAETRTCLLVSDTLDVGGTEEVVAFLARNLTRHGFRTTVLHATKKSAPDGKPSGRLGKALAREGIETVAFGPSEGRRWIENRRPDVVSAHCAPQWVFDAAGELSIPCVETLHGMHQLFGADWAEEAERSKRTARIVCVSDLLRDQYLQGNPHFPAERIVTIPNGVDLARRPLHQREAARASFGIRDEFLFVSLGRHCMQKNTYGLLAAFADVADRHKDAHLVIAGRVDEPAYFLQVLRLRDSLACRERVHLRDNIADPERLLAAADAFVLNSFFEGWALASMEALCAGLPIVVSDVGGAREQVGTDGEKRGYLVPNPVGNPLTADWNAMREARFGRQSNRDALVSAMNRLIEERSAWLAARERLIEESGRRFHPDICLAQHAQVLRQAIDER